MRRPADSVPRCPRCSRGSPNENGGAHAKKDEAREDEAREDEARDAAALFFSSVAVDRGCRVSSILDRRAREKQRAAGRFLIQRRAQKQRKKKLKTA